MNNPEDRLIFNNAYEVLEWLTKVINHFEANKITSQRLDDAHKYVQMYLPIEGWGKTVLNDAIRLRKLYEPNKE